MIHINMSVVFRKINGSCCEAAVGGHGGKTLERMARSRNILSPSLNLSRYQKNLFLLATKISTGDEYILASSLDEKKMGQRVRVKL